MGFVDQIAAFEQKTKVKADTVLRKVCLDLFRGVTLKTPVDTGRARGNWMVGVNQRIVAETPTASKTSPFPRIVQDVQSAKFGDNVSLCNSVPYIGVLEYGGFPNPPKFGSYHKGKGPKGNKISRRNLSGKGKLGFYEIRSVGGYSFQAPQGMVRITIQEYLLTVKRAVSLVQL